jgi:hypothetical protein
MPLPDSPHRTPLHLRKIEMRGYRRDDGLYEIDGRVTDTKHHTIHLDQRGDIAPGDPIHDMWVRLVVDESLLVHDIVAVSDATPYTECREAVAPMRAIVGERNRGGWSMMVKAKLGGAVGCTHLMELLIPMATARIEPFPKCASPPRQAGQERPASESTAVTRIRPGASSCGSGGRSSTTTRSQASTGRITPPVPRQRHAVARMASMRCVRAMISDQPRRRGTSRLPWCRWRGCGIERRCHQHGDAAAFAIRQERGKRRVVRQRVAAGQHEAVAKARARVGDFVAPSPTISPKVRDLMPPQLQVDPLTASSSAWTSDRVRRPPRSRSVR